MKRHVVVITLLVVFSLLPAVAKAGPFTDDMSKCLVNSTSAGDKNELVRWIFSFAGVHPALAGIVHVSDEQRLEINKRMASLTERLLTQSCAAETRAALKNEGQGAMSAAFKVLGEVASVGLFSDPAVATASTAFAQQLDQQKIRDLLSK